MESLFCILDESNVAGTTNLYKFSEFIANSETESVCKKLSLFFISDRIGSVLQHFVNRYKYRTVVVIYTIILCMLKGIQVYYIKIKKTTDFSHIRLVFISIINNTDIF